MNRAFVRLLLAGTAAAMLASAPGAAQRMITPEQRVERLERQVQQLQRRVFPQGQPADTAGYGFEPAATQASVSNLDNRLMALERQIAELLRQSETGIHRVTVLESELSRVRDAQEMRLRQIERRLAERPAEVPAATATVDIPAASPQPASSDAATAAADEGELAYDAGYQLWKNGQYSQAITALRAMASSFPKHRRVSWANNLAGRAMLDNGQPRAAAEALLANYRANPKGERAADSLYYLGQSLAKLNQPAQACKAYSELEAVYGDRMRGELKSLLPKAKAESNC